MKDSEFELLVTSVRQAGRIKRGELEPARKFEVSAVPLPEVAARRPRRKGRLKPSPARGGRD